MSKADYYWDTLRPAALNQMDIREILLLASRFRRHEDEFIGKFQDQLKPVSIAIMASHSVEHFCAVLKLHLVAEGFRPTLHIGPYDAYNSGGFSPNSNFWNLDPDILLLLPSIEDIQIWPDLFATEEVVEDWVTNQCNRAEKLWKEVAVRMPNTKILQGLSILPLTRPLGGLEKRYSFSKSELISKFNGHLVKNKHNNVFILDLEYISNVVGKIDFFDETNFLASKQAFSLRALALISKYVARITSNTLGNIKKCLVLDLDNTLWGGVIGDDGIGGLRLDPSDPVGEAYLRFQDYVLTLKDRGVLLAVCSKNNSDIAKSVFIDHQDMRLRLGDFVSFVANWKDKASNLSSIADEINIGLDSLVFFDDNPAERSLIEQTHRHVLVVDVPTDPALYIRALELTFAFDWPEITEEDIGRSATYNSSPHRQELQIDATEYDNYLQSLSMKAEVRFDSPDRVDRISQLVNKTNQFNTNKISVSPSLINDYVNDESYSVLQLRFWDRFSNYGIVGAVILSGKGHTVKIETWVVSCRVFERGLEYVLFNAILDYARTSKFDNLEATFVRTERNEYIGNLFSKLGFCLHDGATDEMIEVYRLNVASATKFEHFVEIN